MYEDFKDPRGRARVAAIAVIVSIVADIVFAGSEYYTARTIEAFQDGAVEIGALEQTDSLGWIVGLASLAIVLITAIIALFWIYRVNKNAHAVDQGDMTVSPGWNVGYFFVPFANLLMPFRGLRETLQVSTNPDAAAAVPVPALMRLWWAGVLISGALNQISFRLGTRAQTLDDFKALATYNIAVSAVDAAAALLFLWVIRDITRRQVEHIPGRLAALAEEESAAG